MKRKGKMNGLSRSPEYSIWRRMLEMCYDPEHISYPDYGAKGVTVCEAWHSFLAFYDAMGPRPSPGHCLGRISKFKSYTPENTRWMTKREAQQNRRDMRLIKGTVEGLGEVNWTVRQWSEHLGVPDQTLRNRLSTHRDFFARPKNKVYWENIQNAVEERIRTKRTLKSLAAQYGLSISTLSRYTILELKSRAVSSPTNPSRSAAKVLLHASE